LADGGISSAQKIHLPASNEVDTVYVSCLIRTWQTSVLLYGKRKEKLTLVVSPYLKEFIPMPASRRLEGFTTVQRMARKAEHTLLKKGNTPIQITSDGSNDDASYAREEERCVGDSQLSKMKCFMDYIIHTQRDYSALKMLEIRVDGVEYHFNYRSDLTDRDGHWEVDGEEKAYEGEWLEEGDVSLFLKWVRTTYPDERTVHCVAHSKVMQSFVWPFLPQLPSIFNDDFHTYKARNCWSVFGYMDVQNVVSLSALKEGTSEQDEAAAAGRTLCGYG